MPNVFQTLLQTMMFTGAAPLPQPLAPGAPIRALEPNPSVSRDPTIRLKNPVWSWIHDAARPSRLTNIKSKVLGMGINYAHAMTVCDEISTDEVIVTTNSDKEFGLPLDASFVMFKFKTDGGHIPNSSSGLWRLEAELDQSILVVFGYQIVAGEIKPFTREQASALGDNAMPSLGQEPKAAPVTIGQQRDVVLSPLRILVCFSVTCCKERNDFEPGGVLGANRIYPHVMVMSSVGLKRVSSTITVTRPANMTPAHSDPEMGTAIGPIFFSDTNLPRGNTLGPSLPFWDNFFDNHELDPIGRGLKKITVVDGDPASKRAKERRQSGLLMKETLPSLTTNLFTPVDLRKMPRQGDFDNLHLAPRMRIPPLARFGRLADPRLRISLNLDNIAMAPFCVHDCLHTHFRWGVNPLGFLGSLVLTFPDSAKGFDTNFNPNTTEGAPLVPHNQTVAVHLLSASSYSYEGIVHGPVESGRWHVFFHHGMAYANDIFDVRAVDAARTSVELSAFNRREQDFNRGQPPNTPSLNAMNFFSVFYWRLRFSGPQDAPIERLNILDRKATREF